MNMIALTGIAMIAMVISVMIKKYNPEYSAAISIIAGVVILAMIFFNLNSVVGKIESLLRATQMPMDYGLTLFKSLGICFLTQFASDSCNDAGESALASKIELAGKISVIILALPLFDQIISVATKLVGG